MLLQKNDNNKNNKKYLCTEKALR
uniref:Uncharacterized protein n=1 Tax=Anguilla anguilla TaxID=7936 RepID=A0A0E9SE77_ANGAN